MTSIATTTLEVVYNQKQIQLNYCRNVATIVVDIDTVAIILLVLAYLFVVGYGIYYRCRFEKEM